MSEIQFEKSYGIIPLQKREEALCVLLLKHRSGNYWSFPKGHAELHETEKETAERELKEETCLTIDTYLSDSMLQESYRFFRNHQEIEKNVGYFIAYVTGEVSLHNTEIIDYCWIRLDTAINLITFEQSKMILLEALKIIHT